MLLALAVLPILAAPGARAGIVTEGTLITNIACATYGSVQPGCDFVISYCVTATVLVANPNIAINKNSNPTIECSGGTVTFCIYVRNNSAYTSAFNVYVVDMLPDNIRYIQGQQNWVGTTAGAAIDIGYGNTFPMTFNWGAEAPNGQDTPYFLRWSINIMGPGKSALVCWKGMIL